MATTPHDRVGKLLPRMNATAACIPVPPDNARVSPEVTALHDEHRRLIRSIKDESRPSVPTLGERLDLASHMLVSAMVDAVNQNVMLDHEIRLALDTFGLTQEVQFGPVRQVLMDTTMDRLRSALQVSLSDALKLDAN
jgi:hypothetical protein